MWKRKVKERVKRKEKCLKERAKEKVEVEDSNEKRV